MAVDANAKHLVWCEQFASTHHIPLLTAGEVNQLGADVVLPQPDSMVDWLSKNRDSITAKVFLPAARTIRACQDKFRSSLRWYRKQLREHQPARIQEPWPDTLHFARDDLGLPFWLRATRGAGAKGAILVQSLDQAYHWIRFWQSRGAKIKWIAEEYLPGRDFAWSSIWANGELITSFTRERLEYLYPHLTPEGLTGTPTIARVKHDLRVNTMAWEAVKAIDKNPHGIYSVDLREDSHGYPRPTEINAGRGFTTLGLWSLYDINFLDITVKLAMGHPFEAPPLWNALEDGLTLNRHIDCGYVFTRKPIRPLTLCS